MIALLPILSLFAVAAAQNSSSASATDVAVEQAKFEGMWSVHSWQHRIFTDHLGAQLVPQFIPTFSPEGILTMSFGGQQADTGAALDASGKSSRYSERSCADYCSRRLFS
jgi:hypothetical protein